MSFIDFFDFLANLSDLGQNVVLPLVTLLCTRIGKEPSDKEGSDEKDK